jgi:hypothetical protein
VSQLARQAAWDLAILAGDEARRLREARLRSVNSGPGVVGNQTSPAGDRFGIAPWVARGASIDEVEAPDTSGSLYLYR